MSDFAVGDRVQWDDRDEGETYPGTVVLVIPPKRMKTNNYWSLPQAEQDEMITYANVKWDDGTEDAVDMDDLDPEDTPLEHEFRLKTLEVQEEIGKKVNEAAAALREAVKLSEKYGIPFDSPVSFLGQPYTPLSLQSLYPDLDREFVDSVAGVYNEYEDHVGWKHSDVC